MTKKNPSNDVSQDLELVKQLEQLQQELHSAQEREKRALADYRNLQQRVTQQRAQLYHQASAQFTSSLLQPLDHLRLAAQQINDPGLTMVLEQLWQALKSEGLEVIEPLDQPFDIETMEVVDNQQPSQDPDQLKVIKVQQLGFKLHNQVLRHAKVVLG